MSKQIFNLGVLGGIMKAIKEKDEIDGTSSLSKEDLEYLEYLESLPKGEWIDLDDKGMMITPEQARQEEIEHLRRFTTPDGNLII